MDQCKEKKLSPKQKWEQATIANDFIFYKVMRNNPDVCKQLLEILLEIKIDHIVMHQEETIETDYEKKGIRLDVYAKGSDKSFNLEMQATDTGELPELKLNDRAYKLFFIAENYAKIRQTQYAMEETVYGI